MGHQRMIEIRDVIGNDEKHFVNVAGTFHLLQPMLKEWYLLPVRGESPEIRDAIDENRDGNTARFERAKDAIHEATETKDHFVALPFQLSFQLKPLARRQTPR